jgi:hypothetical protein
MGLDFEMFYDAFGGKLAHWCDYIMDFGASFVFSRSTFVHH